MNLGNSEARFAAYVEGLARVIGHADRSGPLRDYCTGLLLLASAKVLSLWRRRRLRLGRQRHVPMTSAVMRLSRNAAL